MWTFFGVVNLPMTYRRQMCLLLLNSRQLLVAPGMVRPQDLPFLQLRYVLILDHQLEVLGELVEVLRVVLG